MRNIFYSILVLWLLIELLNSPILPLFIYFLPMALYIIVLRMGLSSGHMIGIPGQIVLQSRSGYSTWDSTVDCWTKPRLCSLLFCRLYSLIFYIRTLSCVKAMTSL
jgi:hypothetical protein